MEKILVIDDEEAILSALTFALEDEYEVLTTSDAAEGMDYLQQNEIALVLLDQRLGTVNGLDVLKAIKALYDSVPVIAMTAYGSIADSVSAMQIGAYYYLTKPLDLEGLKVLIRKALDYRKLSERVESLSKEVSEKYALENVIGRSKGMRQVCELVKRIRDININVLLTGESGTGKEVIARAIHYTGSRREGPMEIINCAAIPFHLLESELFGYEKGAFTGATNRQKGKLELANGGSLFLDEIGELDIALQAKLLRVIQERQVTPLGQSRPIPLDIRIIAATNKDLNQEVAAGKFRKDLFFRLNVVSILIPPLRERREDIPLLLEHFIQKYNLQFQKQVRGVSHYAAILLENYEYPGNIRELENITERAVALSLGEEIGIADLPSEVAAQYPELKNATKETVPVKVGQSLLKAEELLILSTVEHFGGNRHQAAEVLGISERHLRTKLKQYQTAKSEDKGGEIISEGK